MLHYEKYKNTEFHFQNSTISSKVYADFNYHTCVLFTCVIFSISSLQTGSMKKFKSLSDGKQDKKHFTDSACERWLRSSYNKSYCKSSCKPCIYGLQRVFALVLIYARNPVDSHFHCPPSGLCLNVIFHLKPALASPFKSVTLLADLVFLFYYIHILQSNTPYI